MKLSEFGTGQAVEVDAQSVIELHDRKLYREVTTGLNGIAETKIRITETVPQIYGMIREENRK